MGTNIFETLSYDLAENNGENICQCCLSLENLHSLSESCQGGQTEMYSDILFQCFSIRPYNGMMEGYICEACIGTLLMVYKFRKQVEDAQKIIDQRRCIEIAYQNEAMLKTDGMAVDGLCDDRFFGDTSDKNNISEVSGCKDDTSNVITDEDLIEANDYIAKMEAAENALKEKNRLRGSNDRSDKLPYQLDPYNLTCEICEVNFIFYTDLVNHMPTHFPKHICYICGKLCASEGSLSNHLKRHKSSSLKCDQCGKSYKTLTNLRIHVKTVHLGEKLVYKCTLCKAPFVNFHKRVMHMIERHGLEDKRYKCKECPKRYNHGSHLRAHVRNEHRKERNHGCDKCDFACFTKAALAKHMICHSGVRNFKCEECPRTYTRQSSLREHQKTHRNVKEHVCAVCGKAFVQKCTLRVHMRIHEREMKSDL